MKKVSYIITANSKLERFAQEANQDIDVINNLIDAYHSAIEEEEKIRKLKDIFFYRQTIENKYRDKEFNRCLEFSATIQLTLFTAIQAEFLKYNIKDLYILSNPHPPVNHFASLLSNMSPEKLSRLTSLLNLGAGYSREDFNSLYSPEENPEFDHFIMNHAISFLSGKNSKNFKITPNDDSSAYILKIENRMGMTGLVEAHLRENWPNNSLTPIYAHRQSTARNIYNKLITRRIVVTSFCAGSDLETHSHKHAHDNSLRIKAAINLYAQMVGILKDLSRNGCAFPDMKNTNWLVDLNDKLMIGDTKSFVLCEKNGNISAKTRFVKTPYLNPPEFINRRKLEQPISSDKMHVYMIGKNLYQYLTQCPYNYLNQRHYAKYWDFNYPIFRTFNGQRLKALIIECVHPIPSSRPSIEKVLNDILPMAQEIEQVERLEAEKTILVNQIVQVINEFQFDLLEESFETIGAYQIQLLNIIENLSNNEKLNAILLKLSQALPDCIEDALRNKQQQINQECEAIQPRLLALKTIHFDKSLANFEEKTKQMNSLDSDSIIANQFCFHLKKAKIDFLKNGNTKAFKQACITHSSEAKQTLGTHPAWRGIFLTFLIDLSYLSTSISDNRFSTFTKNPATLTVNDLTEPLRQFFSKM